VASSELSILPHLSIERSPVLSYLIPHWIVLLSWAVLKVPCAVAYQSDRDHSLWRKAFRKTDTKKNKETKKERLTQAQALPSCPSSKKWRPQRL
jgi:hypothetical protein